MIPVFMVFSFAILGESLKDIHLTLIESTQSMINNRESLIERVQQLIRLWIADWMCPIADWLRQMTVAIIFSLPKFKTNFFIQFICGSGGFLW